MTDELPSLEELDKKPSTNKLPSLEELDGKATPKEQRDIFDTKGVPDDSLEKYDGPSGEIGGPNSITKNKSEKQGEPKKEPAKKEEKKEDGLLSTVGHTLLTHLYPAGAFAVLGGKAISEAKRLYDDWQNNKIKEALPDPIKRKVGDKTPGQYVAGKADEQFQKSAEQTEVVRKMNQFQYSDGFKKALDISKKLTTVKQGTPEYDALAKSYNELMQEPFDYNAYPTDWSPTPRNDAPENYQMPDLSKAGGAGFKNTVPDAIPAVKTVKDAIVAWNKYKDQADHLQKDQEYATSDKDQAVKAIQGIEGIKLNKHGEHEIYQFESAMHGFTGAFTGMIETGDLITATPEERAKMGMDKMGKQIIDPQKPTGLGSEFLQSTAGIAPFFIPGIGWEAAVGKGALATVGATVTQGIMMGTMGYSPAWHEQFQQSMKDSGGNQKLAVEMADKTASTHASVDVIVGAAMLPLASKAGDAAGELLLKKDAEKYFTTAGARLANRMSLGDWFLFNSGKHAIGSLPFYMGQVIKNSFDISRGEKKDYFDGAADQYFGAQLLGWAADGVMYGYGGAKAWDFHTSTIAKYAPGPVVEIIQKLIDLGKADRKQGEKAINTIQAKAHAYQMMPDGVTVDAEATILPILMENDQLLKKHNAGDITAMDKIRKNNQEILEITQSPLSYDELKDRAKLKEQEKSNGGRLPQHDRDMLSHYDRRLDAIEATKADMANRKQKAIDDMIDKLSTGDKVDTTPEEQQFYEENKTAIDKGLEDKQTAIDTEKKASIQNKINAGEEITGDDLADKKKFEEDGYEFRPKPAAPPAPTPAPEEVQQHLESNYKKDLDAVHEKVFSGEMTPTEARAEIDKLKDKAAKDLADKKAAENKANRESLEPDMNAFSEYEALQKKKGIKKTNGVSDFLEKMGRKGAAIKAISDNWNDLRNELEKAGIVEIDCP